RGSCSRLHLFPLLQVVVERRLSEGQGLLAQRAGDEGLGEDLEGGVALDVLLGLKARAPVNFDIVAVNLDQKQPGFPEHVLPEYLASIGVEFTVLEQDTYSVVKRVIPEGKTTCSLCSRLRRGALYTYAAKNGITKIALGHHADDILETFFLNLFHGGKLKAMPPKLESDDTRNIVIRPLAYCREKDIAKYAHHREYPIIPCNLCGSQENLQRKEIKKMLNAWEKEAPKRIDSMLAALKSVVPSHLMDTELFDFRTLGGKLERDTRWFGANEAEDGETPPHRTREVTVPLDSLLRRAGGA
ncbi:MAG: tRNA 2-thiocytidine(32) synthetase TtcA, partial [Proteobacteria bacterium]|nr:tRNA 2-thiocytidine(32) synthetase TtcA [Pseudomonadota bacterium]